MRCGLIALAFGFCLSAQIVQESFARDPGPLDFIKGEGMEQFRLQAMTGDSLVGIDASGKVVPRLSPRWTIQKNVLHCELRGDARFSDGSPVGAEDVVWTFQTIQADASASATKRGILENVQVIRSGSGVDLRTAKPIARLLMELASLPIAKRNHPSVGSGPFSLESSAGTWDLKARPHFLNPKIPGLHFRLVSDEQAVLQNLGKGWLTIGVPPARKGLRPPPSHIEIRQPTLAQAIVWSRIGPEPLRFLERWRGTAFPPDALGPRCTASQGLWPKFIGFPEYSIQSSKQSPIHAPRWELIYSSGDETIQRILQAIRERARQDGVNLELRPMEASLLYERIASGRFQLACALNLFAPHPWSILELVEPDGALNFSHWTHPHLREILSRLQNPSDGAWQELQTIWAEAPTALPIVDFQSVIWVDRRLKVQPSTLGIYLSTPGAAGWSWQP